MLYSILTVFLLIMNAVGLLVMLIDKGKARRNAWRIPEATLMGIAALGGSIGVLAGMYLFRHKTRHPKFYLGVPAILVVQVALAVFIASRIGK